MAGFITFFHMIICVLLVVAILMQSGKGGGLAEGFNSAENLLGAQSNKFMVKLTAVFFILFLVTCLTIAVLSSKKERSLMTRFPDRRPTTTANVDKLFDQAPSQTITINAAEPVVEAVEPIVNAAQ